MAVLFLTGPYMGTYSQWPHLASHRCYQLIRDTKVPKEVPAQWMAQRDTMLASPSTVSVLYPDDYPDGVTDGGGGNGGSGDGGGGDGGEIEVGGGDVGGGDGGGGDGGGGDVGGGNGGGSQGADRVQAEEAQHTALLDKQTEIQREHDRLAASQTALQLIAATSLADVTKRQQQALAAEEELHSLQNAKHTQDTQRSKLQVRNAEYGSKLDDRIAELQQERAKFTFERLVRFSSRTNKSCVHLHLHALTSFPYLLLLE